MEAEKKRRILLKNSQSPGDILMLTAAVRDLKLSHPDIEVGVSVTCSEIWDNNPHITKMDEKEQSFACSKIPAICLAVKMSVGYLPQML